MKDSEVTDERETVEDVDVQVLSNKAAKSSQSARELVYAVPVASINIVEVRNIAAAIGILCSLYLY